MKKFGVSSDWLAKRSNSLRQATYSRSSVKSNSSKLDAMIKSASAKPIRSNRKLSFVEPTTATGIEADKENTDPTTETTEKNEEESKDLMSVTTPYDLSSEIDEDKEDEKDDESSSGSKEFSLRIPRVDLPATEHKQLSKRSSSSTSVSSNDEMKQEKPKPKRKRRSKKETATTKTATTKRSSKKKTQDEPAPTTEETKASPQKSEPDEQTTTTTPTTSQRKKPSQKKDKNDQGQSRIEHLKKLLRLSGIRLIIKKAELDELPSHKAKINHLKSLFDTAGYTGSLTIKDCQKFRVKRDTEKELIEIQSSAVDVQGHVKGGRTLRGQGRADDEPDLNGKRKRIASSEVEDDHNSSDDEKPMVKKRRVLTMEASPEVSDNE